MSSWISVRTGYPETSGDNKRYLVYSTTQGICMGTFLRQYKAMGERLEFQHIGTDKSVLDVTHWMELPEPPESYAASQPVK